MLILLNMNSIHFIFPVVLLSMLSNPSAIELTLNFKPSFDTAFLQSELFSTCSLTLTKVSVSSFEKRPSDKRFEDGISEYIQQEPLSLPHISVFATYNDNDTNL